MPPQIIYSEKIPRCPLPMQFADNWHIAYTTSLQITGPMKKQLLLIIIEKILVPYISQKGQALLLDTQHLQWLFLTVSKANAL